MKTVMSERAHLGLMGPLRDAKTRNARRDM